MVENLESVLAEHPFLKGFDKKRLKLLAGCAKNVRWKQGAFIFHSGGKADNFYIIRDGKVSLEISAPGRGHVVFQTLGAGEAVGWSWLIPPYKWVFDARALENTRAVAFDGKCLRDKCEKDNGLGYDLFKRISAVMVEMLQSARLQLMDMFGKSG